MASMIGPLTLTVGQPYKLQLPIDTQLVEVNNDSQNDVWLYFGNTAPTDLTNANNTWHRVIRRGHTSAVPVDGYRGASTYERSNNAFGAFQGTAYLLAVNAGGIAFTGTTSARNQIYVTPYLTGDPYPVHAALATATDLASQPRVVSVPVTITQFAAGSWNPGSGNPFDVQNLQWTADILAAQSAVLYFYGVTFSPAPGQTGSMTVAVQAQPVDSGGGNIGGPVNLFWGSVYCNDTNKTGSGCGWQSPFPLCFTWQPNGWPAGLDHLHILLSKQAGDNIIVNYALACNTDRSNFVPVGDIGNGSLFKGPGGGAPLF